MNKTVKFYLGVIIFCLVISIPLLIPYFHNGFFPTHDGEWTVVRLADMFREVRDLQIPPRFSANLNFGYGYPLFNFAYPFPYYIALVFKMIGFGYVDSIKAVFALSIPISAFFMYLASRNLWKSDFAGLVSSVLYLYFPYRLVDLFVRGSIGESVAFAIIPVILFSLSKLLDNPRSREYKILGGVMLGALILAHNIMAVLFSISLGILFIGAFIIKKWEIVKPAISVFLIGLVLSAYFWIPALFEKQYILLSKIPIADRSQYFVSFDDLLFSKWGYGIPTDPATGFSYQIGYPFLLVLALVGIVLVYKIYKKETKSPKFIMASTIFVGTLIFSLLMFSPSAPFWNLPLLSEINFPWTILSQMGVLISLLAGYLVTYQMTKYLSIGFAMLALVLYLPWAKPSNYVDRGDGFYFTNDGTTTSSSELMPLWVKTFPFERPVEKVLIEKGSGSIGEVNYNSKSISFIADLEEESTIRVNTIYFPGWEALINGEKTELSYSNPRGVMEIEAPSGIHEVELNFGETTIRQVANIISIFGIVYVVFVTLIILYRKFKRKWKK